jgi:hypothetical protein
MRASSSSSASAADAWRANRAAASRQRGRRVSRSGAISLRRKLRSCRDEAFDSSLDPHEPLLDGVLAQRRARNSKKRPEDAHGRAFERAHLGHGGDALESRAPQQLQQHGLRLVVAVMRERDDRFRSRRVHRVAGGPRRGFQSVRGIAIDVNARDVERDATARAKRATGAGPRIGVGTQAVMDVYRGERTIAGVARDQVEQDDGVETARESHAQRFALGGDVRQALGDMPAEVHEFTLPLP